jgi:Trp operon repressor
VSASAAQNLLTKVKQKSSVEYLLASYFYNGSFKTELKPVIRLMMTRNAEEHLKEAWRVIQANIMRTSVQQQIGTAVYTIDNVLDMIDDPALQALKKTNAWRAAAGVGSPRELLDLTTFTAEEIATIKEQVVWLKYFILGFDESSPIHQRVRLYIDILHKSGLSDDDLNQVLNFENIASDDDRFWSFKDREHINVYLIEYVLDAKKTSNLEALKPYLLK